MTADAPPEGTHDPDEAPVHHRSADRSPDDAACPECGAALQTNDKGEPVCLRCGFEQGRPSPPSRKAAPAGNAGPAGPIVTPGRGDLWMPAALGTAALLLLVIGYLAAWPGLYPLQRIGEAFVAPAVGTRLNELLRELVLLLFWSGCGLAALFAMSILLERQVGDARLAAVRIAAVMVSMRLVTIITVPGPRWIEWGVELVLQAVLFIVLAMFFFTLHARNAVILAISTLMAILLLWLFTFAVQWALAA